MNIGFFVWEFWPRLVGGLGSYAVEMTKRYIKLGNHVSIFTINDGELPTSEVWNGIDIHRPLILDSSDIFPIFVTEDLKKWGKNIKFFADIYNYNILSANKYVNQLIKKEKIKSLCVTFRQGLFRYVSQRLMRTDEGKYHNYIGPKGPVWK